tara:strand:+ start:5313 stop:6629 length:1317 start_codon:yes stop_codon:yes gene_type:complete
MKFTSIIKSVIAEQGRYDILKKTYTQPKKKDDKVKPAKMTVDMLDKIVLADPTTRRDGDKIKKAGSYTVWLIKQFLKLEQTAEQESEFGTPAYKGELSRLKELYFEDLYKTTEDLQKYDRFKGQLNTELRDINKLTMDALFNAVKDFSLEKAKTTKAERKTMDVHPGSELVYSGSKYDVYMIEDQGDLGKEAACFYGGQNKETRWCTSAPGLTYFNTYIKQGPLYVLVDKTDTEVGNVSGLPKHRYQFHFPSNQFMDTADRQIDLIKFLNENPELKDIFKPEFAKGLQKGGENNKQVTINYPNDASSKYIALYGFEELFNDLPATLKRFDFVQGNSSYRSESIEPFDLKLPSNVSKFKDLEALNLSGVVSELPEEIGDLKSLMFLSLPNNTKLKSLPKSIANLDNLEILNIKGSNPDMVIPDEVLDKSTSDNGFIIVK